VTEPTSGFEADVRPVHPLSQHGFTPSGLDTDQARRFLDAVKADRFECLYVLALSCGIRRGELVGLKWADINLQARTIRINRQLQRMRDGGGLYFSQPKNASRRTIKLPQTAVEALRSHRKRQVEEQLGAGAKWQANGLVFTTIKGTPLDAQNVTNRSFKPILKKADLPDIPFHALRHKCATLLLTKGVHPTCVQKLLGHQSIRLTLDLYSHWMPPMGEQTAIAMDAASSE